MPLFLDFSAYQYISSIDRPRAPLRINVGRKAAEGVVELVRRETGVTEEVPLTEVVQRIG